MAWSSCVNPLPPGREALPSRTLIPLPCARLGGGADLLASSRSSASMQPTSDILRHGLRLGRARFPLAGVG